MKKPIKKTDKPRVAWVVRTMSNTADDWKGLFVDGKLVAEGHTIDIMSELIDVSPNIPVGIEILDAYIDDADIDDPQNWYKYGGGAGCPKQWTPELEKLAQEQK